MDSSSQNKTRTWTIIAGGCLLVVLLACGISSALGAGGFLLLSRHRSSSVEPMQSSDSGLSPTVAQLTNLQGWVEVQDQGNWMSASEGQLIRSGQHIRSGEVSSVTLQFYDGSTALVDASSELSIDELDAGTGNQTRTIVMTQWSGSSEHQVAKNKREDSRYMVNTSAGTGEAHGTTFRVYIAPNGEAHYMVVEGVVAVTSLESTVLVQAGQVTVIYLGQPPLEPLMSVSLQGELTQIGDLWTIAGQSFKVDEHTVVIGNPQVGDWVLVEGHQLDDGSTIADWIVLIHHEQSNTFNLNGEVDATGEMEWTINDQKIYTTSDTEIDPGIKAGDLVRVQGLILEDGRLEAESIRLQESREGLPFEFSGVIQNMDNDTWLISGHRVLVTAATSISDELVAGDIVLVSGRIQADETWLATSITRVDESTGHFEFSGILESMDPWQVAGISLETRDWTVIAEKLAEGDLVHVSGEIDPNGVWIADEIVRLDTETARMVLIGVVVGKNPWVVSGVALRVKPETEILGEIITGSLVRVELVLGEDEQWVAVRIELVSGEILIPGCIDLVARVVSIDGRQIQLENWPAMLLGEDVQVDGAIVPGSVVRFRLCFDENGQMIITELVVIEEVESEPPESQQAKVLVCHKPDKKKGGHTLSIAAPALPAHLGHGDYEGPCR